MKKIIISITMMLVFTSINAQYYYIGSTIDEVIRIEGEPESIMQGYGASKTLTFDAGIVSFKNGKVESYTNYGTGNGKLKAKYKRPAPSTTSTTSGKFPTKSVREYRAEFIKIAPNFYFDGGVLVQTVVLGDNGPKFVEELKMSIDQVASTTLNMWKDNPQYAESLYNINPTHYRVEYTIGSKRIVSKTLKINI